MRTIKKIKGYVIKQAKDFKDAANNNDGYMFAIYTQEEASSSFPSVEWQADNLIECLEFIN